MIASLALAVSAPLGAQTSATTLGELWTTTVDAALQGAYDEADLSLQGIIDAGSAYGIVHFTTYAEAAATVARTASESGDDELRLWASNSALRLDPESPRVHFILAETARANSDWAGVARSLTKGSLKTFSDYPTSVIARSDFLLSFWMTIAVAGAITALMLLFRYGRPIAHDFRETLGERFNSGFASVVAFALLFLPLLLWLHPIWLAPYWVILVFGYATRTERIVLVLILAVFMTTPVFIEWNSYRIAGLENTVVQGAHKSEAGIYDPAVTRRVEQLVALVPENARLRILMANLILQEGNELRAKAHLEKAIEIDDSIGGAHLNLGNLHFLNQDYPAAIVRYERAAQLNPQLAESFYNHSVAAGEQFDFDTQSAKLAEANSASKSRVDRIQENPPLMKVVNYQLPIAEAWALAGEIEKEPEVGQLYGNYADFNLALSVLNPVSLGSLLALILTIAYWAKRKKTGFAGSCVKCGRTFCHRCKSARESATYCTQCIHIYLKRDGVALDTKKRKLEEVQTHQRATLRAKKLSATFLPGTASILDGNPVRGLIILSFFLLFVSFAVFAGRLAPIVTPAATMHMALRFGSIGVAAIFWIVISLPVYKETAAG